jgi:hypothetical protein
MMKRLLTYSSIGMLALLSFASPAWAAHPICTKISSGKVSPGATWNGLKCQSTILLGTTPVKTQYCICTTSVCGHICLPGKGCRDIFSGSGGCAAF